MLNTIIGFAIRNKLIVGLLTLFLAGYGTYELTRLPIDAVPDITNNQVQVITVAPSFGATDIERLVTFPIEQANANIPGIIEIRSFSRFGLSLVTIVFDDETDVYWARQQVAERLQRVQTEIPQGIGTPELGPVTTGLGEIYQYVVRPKKGYEERYTETELRTLQDWIVRRQLLGVPGVAEVSSFGGKLKQYSIEVEPSRLLSYGITINDVFEALHSNNGNTGGAYIEKTAAALFIRSEGLVGNADDISNIAIKTRSDGSPLFLRDVANITTGHATRYGALCYNDQGEVAGAIVMMLKGGNSNEVIRNVKDRIAKIQKTLPEGVVIEPFLDRTKMVDNAIGTVKKNLAEGALIVVFVLVLFLGNLRAGLLVASVIPLSMLFAIIMMNFFGVSGNLMSLGALDFGLIVDGAVIIVEAVMHRLAGGGILGSRLLNQKEMDEEVKVSAGRMMNSAVFGQIIILIVYLPIFTLEGIEGKMFKPMAQTVAFALLGAFLLSLTYIPMMSALVLSRKKGHEPNLSDRLTQRLANAYQRQLARVLQFPKAILAAAFALFLVSVVILSRMGGEFIPALEEGDFAVETRVLTGSSLTTTIEHTQKAAHILTTRFPEVEKVVTKIGSGEVPTDPMPMEASDMMVILKDKDEWTSAESFNELAAKMGKALEEVPGITTGFQYPVQMRFNELMTGARQDVVCKIFGEDLDTLSRYAHLLGSIAGTVEGTTNIYVEPVGGMPQIVLRYNRANLAQYGLSVADVNRVVNTAFAGQSAGQVYEGEKRFDLVVKLSSEQRKDLTDIEQLLVPTNKGTQVPLHMLADVRIEDGPNQIQREDAKRRIIVGFNVRGRDVESIVGELQQKVEQKLDLPVGYYITYGGAFENLNAAKKRLSIAVPVSLVLILLLLYFAFGSMKQGLLIFSAIPLSAIGGIIFLALRDLPFSISAGVGFIALFGVAVLNGIVLIAEFNRLRDEGNTDLKDIVLRGTNTRLRPVLMTATVASLGFLPMALSQGAGAEVQRPLATVVIGGLLTATFLTLFVLPILYMVFEKRSFFPKKATTTTLLVLLLALAATPAYAQQRITLQAAFDSAMRNNLQLREQRARTEYQRSLIATAKTLPQASVSAEAGQINSAYTDSRFTVAQSFALPKYYQSQRALYNAEWKASELGTQLREAEVKRETGYWYYQIQYLEAKAALLQSADSLYAAFYQRAELRLQKGESNILEKTAAQSQWGNIRNQREQLEADREAALLQWQLLLQTGVPYLPLGATRVEVSSLDTSAWQQHIQLRALEGQRAIAEAQVQLEKAKLLPELTLGYNNTSFKGVGADDKLYPGSRRFSSGLVGVSIPIFSAGQRARVQSARLNQQAGEVGYEARRAALKNAHAQAMLQYNKFSKAVQYYEKEGLQQALQVQATASQQLARGSINYLEWVQLVNSALATRSEYLEALQQLNASIIELNYFNSKQ